MRAFPQAVRSAILDSVLPAETTALGLHQLGSFDHMLNEAFTRCAADAACHQACPDLKQSYLDLVAHLDIRPLTVRVDPSGTLRVDGCRFGEAVIQQLYAGPGETPALIAAGHRGQDGVVARWLAPTVQAGRTEDLGMHLSISCHDGVAAGPPEALAQVAPAVLPGRRRAGPRPPRNCSPSAASTWRPTRRRASGSSWSSSRSRRRARSRSSSYASSSSQAR